MSGARRTRMHGGVPWDLAGDVLDLSSNVCPYGPADALTRAVREADLTRYPDPQASAARGAWSATLDVPAEQILFGNGAADLLWSLARTLLGPGERWLEPAPTFSEFAAAATSVGAQRHTLQLPAAQGFALDVPALEARIEEVAPSLVHLCVPNNPSGHAISLTTLQPLFERYPRVRFVLDQSFLALSDLHGEARWRPPSHVVCVRSLTKEHALPGVRVGYALADAALCERIELQRPAWTVSAAAQAAATAAASEEAHVSRMRERMFADRQRSERALKAAGYSPVASNTTFVLVEVGDAARLTTRLLQRHRVLVRDCTSFGLPAHVRLAGTPAAHFEQLGDALASV